MTATTATTAATGAQISTPPAAGPVSTVAPTARRERLLALDVFRGLTVAGMLLVNDPGSWAHIYPPLEHAPWNGWTPTDLIFPFFLFIVGITTQLSATARRARGATDADLVRNTLRRGALIFLFGLLLNFFPFFQWGAVPGIPDPSVWDRIAFRLEHLRIMGVLQRIAVAYTVAGLIALRTSFRTQLVTVVTLLLGYWAVVMLVPVPGTGGQIGLHTFDNPALSLQGWLDRLILTPNHMWIGATTHDPEGILSSVTAVCTALLGNFAGRWIGTPRSLSERLNGLFAGGALAMVAGLVWNWVFPINKNLWTSSYVLFTAGMAATALAVAMWLIDERRSTWWTKPLVVFGVNPIVAFVGSGILARLIYSIIHVTDGGETVSLVEYLFRHVYAPIAPDPRVGSLLFALTFDAFWFLVLWALHRRNIILKI